MATTTTRRVMRTMAGFAAGVGCSTAASAAAEEVRNVYGSCSADDEYPDLAGATHLTAGVLTRELWRMHYHKQTHRRFTFNDVIQAGVDNPVGAPTDPGCVAGDEECYFVYKDLYNPVIRAKHGWDVSGTHIQDVTPDTLRGGRLDGRYVMGVRIRASRNFFDHRYSPGIGRGEREEVKWSIQHACSKMSTPFQGRWVDVKDLSGKDFEEMVSEGVVPGKILSPFLQSAGVGRDWPLGRGAHISKNKDVLVWANDSDHVKIIATQKNGDITACFGKWCMATIDFEAGLREIGKSFVFHRNFGYLGPSLSNLGTAFRVSVVAKLPLASTHPSFDSFIEAHHLTKNTSPAGGSVEIYNTNRFHTTESATVQNVIDVMQQLIAYEKVLESGKKIKNF